MRGRHGFTLVELLVGMAILMMLLGILGALLLSTRRAYETNQAATASSGQVRSAIEFLEYDISLAGYGLTGSPGLSATDCERTSCNPQGLAGRMLESLTVNYVEDRFTGGSPMPVSVTYLVTDGLLVRCLNPVTACSADTGSSIAEGIAALGLRDWRTSSGGTAVELPSDVSGVDLVLHYHQADGVREEEFSVALLNPQGSGS